MATNKQYTVDKKIEMRKMNDAGDVITVYRISAKSTGGTYFSVDVPEADLARADTFLAAKATQLDSIR